MYAMQVYLFFANIAMQNLGAGRCKGEAKSKIENVKMLKTRPISIWSTFSQFFQ
jgi:hypothetical protein